MTKNLLVLIIYMLLSFSSSINLPTCCSEIHDYVSILQRFKCNLFCETSQMPLESSCLSCLRNMSEFPSNLNDTELTTKPAIICQDLFYKLKSKERKFWGRAVLTWPLLSNVSSFYSIEVRIGEHMATTWHFLGMTNTSSVVVNDMDFYLLFQFRVTPFVLPDLILPPLISDWTYLAGENSKGFKALSLSSVDFELYENSVQAVIEWTLPKEAPCSFQLQWRPATQYSHSMQKTLSLPRDASPIILPDLLFQTKYVMTLSPVYQSDIIYVTPAEKSFTTPSCLSLTKENFTLCAPGPPLNVSAIWVSDTEASVTWLPPDYASNENEVTGYHLSVSEASKGQHTRYKENFAVERNILIVKITDLKPGLIYIVEVRATSQGGVGPPVAVDMNIKEPVESSQHGSDVPWHYIVPSSVFATTVILVALCINFLRRKKKHQKTTPGYPSGAADVPEHLLPHLISVNKIDLDDEIGKGEFGTVYKGSYLHNRTKEVVAVKVFPSESVSRSKLIHEVEILHIIGRHPNVVRLIGFTLDVDKICLVLEHCALGNLHARICRLKKELSVIKNKISDPKQPLIEMNKGKDDHYGVIVSSYIHQIAVGMEYISSLNLIHRDLAARNILLVSEKHVKIADFGLAKDVSEDPMYAVLKQRRLPIRWMAPESLEKQTFSTHSDVWSFGILMWEIFKFGKVPYTPLNNSAILMYLRNGYRLQKPSASSQLWYNLMLECWHIDPFRRPTFKELVIKTENILSKLSQYSVITSK